MEYGATIGKKFYVDGSVRRYPGNTVVADILPGCPAYDVMATLRQWVMDEGLAEYMILMPEDSYHMTLFRGLNDQVREAPYWPAALPKDTPMTKVDDWVSAAVEKAGLPGPARMKFDSIRVSKTCMIVRLQPADEEQNRILRQFRDRGAENVGVFFPKHENYTFHITLAYTRIVPEGAAAEKLEALKEKINAYLATQPEFYTAQPYMAYYDDMLRFHPERIPRD
jgi:hypothetical protein